jgi:hypothetical protein
VGLLQHGNRERARRRRAQPPPPASAVVLVLLSRCTRVELAAASRAPRRTAEAAAMVSAEAAPPQVREGKTQRDEQDGMRDVLLRCGHAYSIVEP